MTETWSVSETARATGISRGTISRLRKDGRLRQFEVQIGGRVRLRVEGLREFLTGGGLRARVDSPWARSPGPASHVSADARGRHAFWVVEGYGRLAGPDEADLSDAEFWEHVAKIVSGMFIGKVYSGDEIAELQYQINEAIACVDSGIRWAQSNWDRASTLALIGDAGCCASARAELSALLEGGNVPTDLEGAAREALAVAALQH